MSSLQIKGICKQYGDAEVLRNISLSIRDGEFIALVGPSGCGKSTLLRIIAGLEQHNAGNIELDQEVIDHKRASERNLAMVFQSYALYPHLSVRNNIATPLLLRDLNFWQQLPLLGQWLPGSQAKRKQINQRVEQAATALDIQHLLERKPGQLSGGQRQRVAVGRALVRQPAAFLLDEPLSNLDAKLRVQMRMEISQLHRSLGATFIYVTHDQSEAMTMADRIAVVMDGKILQCASPAEIYNHPVDIRVAEFIGSPAINIFPVDMINSDYKSMGVASVGLRAEALTVDRPSPSKLSQLTLSGLLSHVEHLGAEQLLYLQLVGKEDAVVVKTTQSKDWGEYLGESLGITIDETKAVYFDCAGQSISIAEPLLEVANG